MKFTTVTLSVFVLELNCSEYLTDGTSSVVTEALDELDRGDSPCLPWDSTSDTRKSCPLLLSREGTKKSGVLILHRVGRAGIERHRVEHSGALGDLKASLDVGSGSHCSSCSSVTTTCVEGVKFKRNAGVLRIYRRKR